MHKFELKPNFTDARGAITDLLNDVPITSVAIVTSRRGAVRGNKFHREANKYTYVIQGSMEWFHREAGTEVKRTIFKSGDFFLTPAGESHAMRFLEDTVLMDMTTQSRAGTGYEDDTVRLEHPLITVDQRTS